MSTIEIVEIRLSGNPDTVIKNDANGINGKINETNDGRSFAIMTIQDRSNLRKFRTRQLIYSADEKGNWPALTPKELQEEIKIARLEKRKLTLNGEVVTRNVVPYEVGERTVNSYTTIVLSDENIVTVFENAGHPIITEDGIILKSSVNKSLVMEQ